MTYEVHNRSPQHQPKALLSEIVCRGVLDPRLLLREWSVVEPSTSCFRESAVRGEGSGVGDTVEMGSEEARAHEDSYFVEV
jgi:hypothetical protein